MGNGHDSNDDRIRTVFETVRRLIGERGMDNVNMRDLASESGVSVPTLYKLIGDRETILVRAVESWGEGVMDEAAENAPTPGLEKLMSIWEQMARSTLSMKEYSRQVTASVLADRMDGPVLRKMYDLVRQTLQSALEDMKADNHLESWVEPGIAAAQMTSCILINIIEWYNGVVPDENLPAAIFYGAGLMALGLSKGAARKKLAGRVEELQGRAFAGEQT